MARQRRSFGRIRQRSSGRWQAAYTAPDGKTYSAPSTFAAKVDAEAWLTDRRRDIDRELWSPPADTEQRKKAATRKKAAALKFEDYAAKWVNTRMVRGQPLKPRTKDHYTKLLSQHINPTFGAKPVASITRESVERWYRKLDPDTPTVRAHAYSLLKSILGTAITDDKLLDANPCQIRGAGSTERRIKPRPLDHNELAALVAAMPEDLRAMTLLASWGALRFGELVALRRCDITGDVVMVRRGAVRLKGEWIEADPKSSAGRRDVVLPSNILPALQHHLDTFVDPDKDALLFPARGGGYLQPSTLYRHFYKARAAAKRPDLRWHDLRHSGAVLAAQTGATLAELMARLGHSTPQAALRYQHQAQGRDRIIAQRMAAALSNLAADTPETDPGENS
ncbi:putative prophage phiRv2 integrase [Mycolicibacterium chitae]|uniref:Site-specific recombinase XerD n=1 Tax=Mycolicibacterium chitae TaxID=1792 RepID=A0A3S4RNF7_MYCCI|nr:site-specific integrase [Mycolicibacterium chitae]MCV7104224.1 site-specific integrase [Mycolicibacterium chitae]BBZ04894.1 putative prophage phiRv2 integrase [Mycolicibacterium chitae]VEG48516.1 site-specific recombinase XerD [Mycolicibacterium chitae]